MVYAESELKIFPHRDKIERVVAREALLYMMFESGRDEPFISPNCGLYSYGLLNFKQPLDIDVATPEVWKLDRTDGDRRLIPHSHIRELTMRLPGTTLVLPETEVSATIGWFDSSDTTPKSLPSGLDAERLFKVVQGQKLGNTTIDACATYGLHDGHVRIEYVNQAGGYSIGRQAAYDPALGDRLAPLYSGHYQG